jgi:hypothetical protein
MATNLRTSLAHDATPFGPEPEPPEPAVTTVFTQARRQPFHRHTQMLPMSTYRLVSSLCVWSVTADMDAEG